MNAKERQSKGSLALWMIFSICVIKPTGLESESRGQCSRSGKSSTTSPARMKAEAERAKLFAHVAALRMMHAME